MTTQRASVPEGDSLAWLDEINGDRALAWVRDQNARTARQLTQSALFQRNYDRARAVHLEREPMPLARPSMMHEGWVYDLLVDAAHPRGLWRRIELAALLSGSTQWQSLIDVTGLAQKENRALNLVLPVSCFGKRCLVRMEGATEDGRPGSDIREFDLDTRAFVKNGFVRHSGPHQAAWKDVDTVLLASDYEPSVSSARGMPISVREWTRDGNATREIFRGDPHGPLGVTPFSTPTADGTPFLTLLSWEKAGTRSYVLNPDRSVTPTLLPNDFHLVGVYDGQLIGHCETRNGWIVGSKIITPGSLVSIPRSEIGRASPTVHVILEPRERESTTSLDVAITSAGLLVATYQDVRARLSRFTFDGSQWRRQIIPIPDHGSVIMIASDPSIGTALVSYESFLQPATLYAVDVGSGGIRALLNAPSEFATTGLITEQHEAISSDGTRVPYFIVRRRSSPLNGQAPTLLYGYGALGNPLTPHYDGAAGRLWLEEGGVFVLANVRGGGEFGPAWHVRGPERQRTYEDFIAVAEDLIRRNVTSSRHLGIRGHSNGGLLVGATLNLRPDLFNAAVIEHPVLDLHLHTRDLDSDEYGAWSSPEERTYLEAQSPLQNLRKRHPFPAPLIKTATDDDVLPSQARKYAAKLAAFGMPFYYFETAGGRHALADTPQDAAYYDALVYTYLAERLR